MTQKTEILLIDDDESIRMVVAHQLREAGYIVIVAEDGNNLEEILQKHKNISIALIDNKLPGKSGQEILKEIKINSSHVTVIFMTAYSTVDLAVEIMKSGAFDFLTKPISEQTLLMVVKRAEEVSKVYQENLILKKKLDEKKSFQKFLTISDSMKQVLEDAQHVAVTDAPVLITGETGTGKELLAHAIHNCSGREKKNFVTINCGAIPENLLESELFGYKKGAFTGAVKDKEGKLEYASGGTLFLDEIGELPLNMQVKLLRVLQEKTMERVGDIKTIEVDIRIIAATNRNLEEEIKKGNFRADLYYRLSVVPLRIPSLKERKDDVPFLIQHFFEKYCTKYKKNLTMNDSVIKKLTEFSWPGNIRQLKNSIERMVILATKKEISSLHISDGSENFGVVEVPPEKQFLLPKEGIKLEEVEKSFIEQALVLSNGNQSKAARLLGVTRNTLIYRLQKFNL